MQPNTIYYLQIQYITPEGENIRSDPVVFRTDDECKRNKQTRYQNLVNICHLVPPSVNNLRVERTTMTAARVAWDPPDLTACNSLRAYQIYLGKSM